MPEYRPPQRVVPARVLLPSGWIYGSFHVPRLHSFLEFLGHPTPFFNLTDVELLPSCDRLGFLALRRTAARLILPSCDERRLRLAPDPPNAASREVTCLLEMGAVSGRLSVPPHLRVSDHLTNLNGFVRLRDAELGAERTRVPVLFLNAAALVGVSDGRPERHDTMPVETEALPVGNIARA